MTLPGYHPHCRQRNKIPKDLFEKIRLLVYEKAYLSYHDDEGCHYVLNELVDILHEYSIQYDSGDKK
jgi:hypothetical protein